MSERRRTKKSESVEVRVEHELKEALMHRAQAEGRSVSDLVRESLAAYLAQPEKETRSMLMIWKPVAALGVGAAAILWSGLTAGPAVAMPDLRVLFDAMDKDGNKSVTMEEFALHTQDHMTMVKHHGGAHQPPTSTRPFILPLRKDAPPPPRGTAAPPPGLLKTHFAEQDSNKDGSVSFAEFRAHHHQLMQASFAAVDSNGDGSLDRAEYEAKVKAAPGAALAPGFGEIDRNGDGRVTGEEYFGHG